MCKSDIDKIYNEITHMIHQNATGETQWVFRGVSSQSHSLKPSIARRFPNDDNQWINRKEQEYFNNFVRASMSRLSMQELYVLNESQKLFLRDIRKAENRNTSNPEVEEQYIWYALMQHFGLPTRLLDWSESPWVSLFFGCMQDSSNTDTNGAIYAFNKKINLINPRQIVPNIFELDPNPDSNIVIIDLPRVFPRIINQMGLFTVSEDPKADHFDLINVLAENLSRKIDSAMVIKRIIIPSQAKEFVRVLLRSMQISPATVFPELEAVARSIAE